MNQYKDQKMCEKAVNDYPFMLKFLPDWFVTPNMLDVLDNVEDVGELIVWHNEHKQRKAYKKGTCKGLISIAWPPSRMWGWYMPENEKKK